MGKLATVNFGGGTQALIKFEGSDFPAHGKAQITTVDKPACDCPCPPPGPCNCAAPHSFRVKVNGVTGGCYNIPNECRIFTDLSTIVFPSPWVSGVALLTTEWCTQTFSGPIKAALGVWGSLNPGCKYEMLTVGESPTVFGGTAVAINRGYRHQLSGPDPDGKYRFAIYSDFPYGLSPFQCWVDFSVIFDTGWVVPTKTPTPGAGPCNEVWTMNNAITLGDGNDLGRGLFTGGTVTLIPCDPNCEVKEDTFTPCKRNNCPNLCVDLVLNISGTPERIRWYLYQRTDGGGWYAATTNEAVERGISLSFECTDQVNGDPVWIATITDLRPGPPTPFFGTIVFKGDGKVCPNEVGLWELVSSTETFDSIDMFQVAGVTGIDGCPAVTFIPNDCKHCPKNLDTGVFAWTYGPGGLDPALFTDCKAMYDFALAGSINVVYDAASFKWKGSQGTPGTPGYITVEIEYLGNNGPFCKWGASMTVLGTVGNAAISTSSLLGTTKRFSGSTRQSPCDGGGSESKWNVTAELNPTGCWDTDADTCIDGDPDDQGFCS